MINRGRLESFSARGARNSNVIKKLSAGACCARGALKAAKREI